MIMKAQMSMSILLSTIIRSLLLGLYRPAHIIHHTLKVIIICTWWEIPISSQSLAQSAYESFSFAQHALSNWSLLSGFSLSGNLA